MYIPYADSKQKQADNAGNKGVPSYCHGTHSTDTQ